MKPKNQVLHAEDIKILKAKLKHSLQNKLQFFTLRKKSSKAQTSFLKLRHPCEQFFWIVLGPIVFARLRHWLVLVSL